MRELAIGVCDDLAEERARLSRMIQAYARKRGLAIRVHPFSGGRELPE